MDSNALRQRRSVELRGLPPAPGRQRADRGGRVGDGVGSGSVRLDGVGELDVDDLALARASRAGRVEQGLDVVLEAPGVRQRQGTQLVMVVVGQQSQY